MEPISKQTVDIHGDRNIIVQAEGSGHQITVNTSAAYLSLVPAGSSRSKGPQRDLDLLDPALCAVHLTGREQDMADLRLWVASPSIVSVRALVGPAGSGKTRLAHELALELKTSGENSWDAGFLSQQEARRFVSAHNLSSWAWKKDTLIVVDDAAVLTSELRAWLSELAIFENRKPGSPRLRLLLLEREANTESGWYADLPGGDWSREAVRDLFEPWQPVQICPLNESVDRRYILETTLSRGAALRGIAIPPIPPLAADPWFDKTLGSVEWSEPLLLMMAALTALETGVPEALSLSRRDIASRVALREIDRIARFAPTEKAAHLLIDFAACIIFCNGLPASDARSLAARLSNLGLQYPEGPHALFLDLQRALPGNDARIEPIRPDLVGEAFLLHNKVWKTAPAEELIPIISILSEQNVAATVIRTAMDFADPQETRPVEWLDRLIANCRDPERLDAINNLFPATTLCLPETALTLAARLVEAQRLIAPPLSDEQQSNQARLLHGLSIRQSDLDRREDALASSEEAVTLYRSLAVANPHTLLPNLALSLNNLSNRRSALGRHEEALAASEEAVALYRFLDGMHPDTFLTGLAGSLNNLSNRQSDLGKREEALASAEESVVIRRSLAAVRPDVFRPDLASSLNNLSNRQSALDKRAEALTSIEEAVALYRLLAAARRDAFSPALARSLHNLSLWQWDLGKPEEALTSIEDAVALFRCLAASRPDAFVAGLAGSLNNLSNRQGALGKREDALVSIQEAVTLYRSLAAVRPEAFAPDLALSLNNLSNWQNALGNYEDALASIEEAVTIYRSLVAASPDVSCPELASSLHNLSNCQNALDKREDALVSIQEAVLLRRALAAARPDAYNSDLASSLSVLGICRASLGRTSESLGAASEALLLFKDFFSKWPIVSADLAKAFLNDYLSRCRELGVEPSPELIEPYMTFFEPDQIDKEDK